MAGKNRSGAFWWHKARLAASGKQRSIIGFLLAGLAFSALLVGEVGTAKLAAAFANPLSIFTARSPGERTAGYLAQTKPARRHAIIPTERVKSQVRTRPPLPSGVGTVLPGDPSDRGLAGTPGFYDDNGAGLEGVGSGPDYTGGGGIPGLTAFDTGPPPGQLIDNATASIESSVPEPATWMTLIAGIFIIGSCARSGRPRAPRRLSSRAADRPSDAPSKPGP